MYSLGHYMNTTNTLALSNYLAAAEAVQDLLDEYGFTSNIPVDGLVLKYQIASKIQDMLTGTNATKYYVANDPNLEGRP